MRFDKPYKSLIAWQKADCFVQEVYSATKDFPAHELYGVVSQLRRASLSVPLNIVEGLGRQGLKENKRFLNIALGSLMEADYLLYFSNKQGFLNDERFNHLESLRKEAGAVLWGYYRSF